MNKKINQFFTKQFPKDNIVDIYKSQQYIKSQQRYDLVILKIAVPDQEPTELLVDKQDQGNRDSPCTDT